MGNFYVKKINTQIRKKSKIIFNLKIFFFINQKENFFDQQFSAEKNEDDIQIKNNISK